MAKEFKEFDKVYAKWKGKLLGYETADKYFNLADSTSPEYGEWEFASEIALWTTAQIREAVYMVDTSKAWQMFRVSLKGNNTYEKLYRLAFRRAHIIKLYGHKEYMGSLERIRIENYIGALRRGGQLDANYNVAK